MSLVQLSASSPQHPKPHPSRTHTPGPRPITPLLPSSLYRPHRWGPYASAPRRCPSSISAPPPSLAPPRTLTGSWPGQHSQKDGEAQSYQMRQDPTASPQPASQSRLPRRSWNQTYLQSLHGRAGPAHAPSCQNASSGFENAEAAAAAEEAPPPGRRRQCGGFAHSALSGLGGKRVCPGEPRGQRAPDSS